MSFDAPISLIKPHDCNSASRTAGRCAIQEMVLLASGIIFQGSMGLLLEARNAPYLSERSLTD